MRAYCGVLELRHGWVRLFGFNIGWKDTRVFKPLFSERNGYKKHFRVGAWSFSVSRHVVQPIASPVQNNYWVFGSNQWGERSGKYMSHKTNGVVDLWFQNERFETPAGPTETLRYK